MKPTLFFSTLLLATVSCYAQFTLTPQIGFDQSKTRINYNQLKTFSPADGKTFLKAALRADYRTKKGHGAFAGIGSSPSVWQYSFANPSDALNNFKVSTSGLQWRLEAGYQYTSKMIPFKTPSKQSKTTVTKSKTESSSRCGAGKSYTGAKKSYARENKTKSGMRLQPFLGMAYLPSVNDNIVFKGNSYQYNAGNWKTAVVTGMNFEFTSAGKRIASLGFTYTKGLGNLDRETIITNESGKIVTNSFSSKTSNWGLTFGVPISLSKNKKPVAKKYELQRNYKSKCGYYRSRCTIRMN